MSRSVFTVNDVLIGIFNRTEECCDLPIENSTLRVLTHIPISSILFSRDAAKKILTRILPDL